MSPIRLFFVNGLGSIFVLQLVFTPIELKRVIKINPKFKSLLPYLETLDENFAQSGTTIYKDRNEVKVMDWNGCLINVKKYTIPNVINRVVYTTLRKPKAVRAYHYADILRENGIATPEPIGYRLEKKGLNLGYSYLVTVHLPSQNMLYEFGEGGIEGREDIIKGLGAFAGKLHDAGILHLDFSPGNVLYKRNDEGEIEFNLVDINRLSFGPVSIRKGCASFERLWGGDDFLDLLSESYAEARGEKNVEMVKKWIHNYHRRYWSHRSPWVIKK